MIYLDASVLVPLVVTEATTERVIALCKSRSGEIAVSDFAFGEATAALTRLVRTGTLQEVELEPRLRNLEAFAVDLANAMATTSADIRLATTFVRQHGLGLRLPDAVHLALCRRNSHSLVTSDRRLTSAATRLSIETIAV